MATPSAKLAGSLDALRTLQDRGVVAVRSADLARTHRERLVRHGFLQPVIKGWYVAASPGQGAGDSTAWYASFWNFCAGYLNARFGTGWCLSPEQSLALHAGNRTVPRQLLVRASKGRNQVTPLPHGTSLLEVRAALPPGGEDVVTLDGMRAFSLPAALIACPARFFRLNPVDARTALALVPDRRPCFAAASTAVVAARSPGAWPPPSAPSVGSGSRTTSPKRCARPISACASATPSGRRPSPSLAPCARRGASASRRRSVSARPGSARPAARPATPSCTGGGEGLDAIRGRSSPGRGMRPRRGRGTGGK